MQQRDVTLADLELCVDAEQTRVVFDQAGFFGSVQEADEQQKLLQREAGQRLLMACSGN